VRSTCAFRAWYWVGLVSGFFGSVGTIPAARAQGRSDSSVVALVGGRIYRSPGAAPIDDGVIVVRGKLIIALGQREAVSVPTGAKMLDCSGRVIVAGFWNSHVHFTEPHWTEANALPASTLTRQLRQMLVQYGFVRVLDTGSPLANTLALRRRIESGEVSGPNILTTGPGFVPDHGSPFYILPAQLPELRSPAEARAKIAARLKEGGDAIKLFTGSSASATKIVPMPIAIVRAATAEAHRRRKVVLAHPGNNEGLRAALEGGVNILAHTTPDGGPWAARVPERMKRAHMALIPTLKLWAFELGRRGGNSGIIETFEKVAIDQLHSYVDHGGEILFGTDVGYMTEYDPTDEYRYMQRAGMSFRQILASLTTTPARWFGTPNRVTGRLQRGASADIVVLEADPTSDIGALAQVRYVLRAGRMIFSRD
jgi:imidazolonepropionase-like amidohydrolase